MGSPDRVALSTALGLVETSAGSAHHVVGSRDPVALSGQISTGPLCLALMLQSSVALEDFHLVFYVKADSDVVDVRVSILRPFPAVLRRQWCLRSVHRQG